MSKQYRASKGTHNAAHPILQWTHVYHMIFYCANAILHVNKSADHDFKFHPTPRVLVPVNLVWINGRDSEITLDQSSWHRLGWVGKHKPAWDRHCLAQDQYGRSHAMYQPKTHICNFFFSLFLQYLSKMDEHLLSLFSNVISRQLMVVEYCLYIEVVSRPGLVWQVW